MFSMVGTAHVGTIGDTVLWLININLSQKPPHLKISESYLYYSFFMFTSKPNGGTFQMDHERQSGINLSSNDSDQVRSKTPLSELSEIHLLEEN